MKTRNAPPSTQRHSPGRRAKTICRASTETPAGKSIKYIPAEGNLAGTVPHDETDGKYLWTTRKNHGASFFLTFARGRS
jgi:hypothetical protein